MTQKAIITDLNRCTGCLSCTVACKLINDVPVGNFWVRTLRVGPVPKAGGTGDFPDVDMYYLPVQCQHCANPECVEVCPTGASVKLDDGTDVERTILSGIHADYEPEDLVGKTLVAITNLPPRKMMGIDSCGMLLSAIHEENGEERLNLLQLDSAIPAGAKLY